MAQLQSTNIVGTLSVNGVAVGGGKDFKFACFTGSTTFTPSSDLVDGDGALNLLLVGGGGAAGAISIKAICNRYNCSATFGVYNAPGGGGGVYTGFTPITSTDACTVTVGAGAVANGVSLEGGSTAVYTNNSTNGGDTYFGDIGVAGGGNGFSRTCIFASGYQSITATCCPSTRNAGEGTFGGGAESFHYAFCNGIRGNTNDNVFDDWGQTTGSLNWSMFDGDPYFPNNGTGTPNYFGLGGSAPIIGGSAGGRPTAEGCYNYNFTSSVCAPERFYGAGGNGDGMTVCNTPGVYGCGEVQGVNGNSGIIVLTWYQ